MRLYSYVVARDYGFAPNPFGAYCTLATCKPGIRGSAQVGDWVVGTGSATKSLSGHLVYAMRVSEAMTFDQYWNDARFEYKRPHFDAALKHAFGDNIYHHVAGQWMQENSHHSFSDGTPNDRNVRNDTKADRVLVATEFAYWGGEGPVIPKTLRNFHGHDICIGRGFKFKYPPEMVAAFIDWFHSLGAQGFNGEPAAWQ